MPQLRKILRHERIHRRNMRSRNPRVLPGEHQQQMLEVIFRKYCDGPLDAQPAIEQRLRDTPHRRINLRIRKRPPSAILRIALRRANPLRRDFRPLRNAIGENFRIRAKRLIGAHQQRTVRQPLDGRARSAKPHMPHTAARFFQSTRRRPRITHDWLRHRRIVITPILIRASHAANVAQQTRWGEQSHQKHS